MTDNTARVSIAGEAAQRVATEVLNASGMDPEHIDGVELSLAVDGQSTTELTITGEGPHAGTLLHEMVSEIDFGTHSITSVDAEFTEGNGTTSEPPIVDDSVEPSVELLGYYADAASAEYPKGHSRDVVPGTVPAKALTAMWHYIGEEDAHGAMTPELDEADNDIETYHQAGSGLAKLYNDHKIVGRIRASCGGGIAYRYLPTVESLDEYVRLHGERPPGLTGEFAAAGSGGD